MTEMVLQQWRVSLVAAGRSPHTVRAYVGGVARVAAACGVDPVELRGEHVTEYMAACECQASRCQSYKALRLWAKWLNDIGHPTGNVLLAGVTAPEQPEAEARPVTENEYRAIIGSALGVDERAMILLAAEVGLRLSEIARVRAEDFDGPAVLLVRGKGRRHKRADRVAVPVSVQRHAALMPAHGWWFPSPVKSGQPISDTHVWKMMREAMWDAGVDATPHQLRHRYATNMVRRGVALSTVSKMMRHRSIRTTQRYVLVDDSDMFEALRLIQGNE